MEASKELATRPEKGLKIMDTLTYDGQDIQILMRDGEDWWGAAEVSEVLEITNNRDAVSRLKDDEKMTVALTDSRAGHGAQMQTLINEPGLYRLIMRSRKKKAEDFQWWVAHKVLPEIRRRGTYGFNPDTNLTIVKQIVEMQLQITEQLKSVSEAMTKGGKKELHPSVPDISYRLKISQLIRKFVAHQLNGYTHQDAFDKLYYEYKYRYHVDLKERAKNSKSTSIMDYAEYTDIKEGTRYVQELYELALVLFPES